MVRPNGFLLALRFSEKVANNWQPITFFFVSISFMIDRFCVDSVFRMTLYVPFFSFEIIVCIINSSSNYVWHLDCVSTQLESIFALYGHYVNFFAISASLPHESVYKLIDRRRYFIKRRKKNFVSTQKSKWKCRGIK